MVEADLHTILNDYRSRFKRVRNDNPVKSKDARMPTVSEIPDIFFDHVLVEYKLSRIEIMVLMYLYRHVWCRPNLYKVYGISQLLSHTEMVKALNVSIDDVYHSLRVLEGYSFIMTVRSGQYFVRKYFLKDLDEKYSQTYDDFEV